MEYVKIINPGDTYERIADTPEKMAKFGCNNIIPGLPIRGNYYLIIARTPHPTSPGTELISIQDGAGRQYIVGPSAYAPVDDETTTSYGYENYNYYSDGKDAPTVARHQSIPRPVEDKYHGLALYDTVEVIDMDSMFYRNKYDVTDLKYPNHEVVVGKVGTKEKQKGFKFSQLKKFIPEPELAPDDKPQFSKNEILEILNQDKNKDEIILDLMDHITN